MTGEEFLEVINNIDESFIAEAAPKKQRHPGAWRRVIAVAAVITMLATLLTVSAAGESMNFRIIFGKDNRPVTKDESGVNNFGNEEDSLNFITIDIDYQLQPVTLKESTYRLLTAVATSRWKKHLEDEKYDRLQPNGEPKMSFCTDFFPELSSLEEVEEYLGIHLAVTSEIRNAAAEYMPKQVSEMVFRLCIGSASRAEKMFNETGEVTPVGIEIRFYMSEAPMRNELGHYLTDQLCGDIFIPLDEEYADYRTPYSMVYYEGLGEMVVEEHTFGEQKLTLIYNKPKSGWYGQAEAVYSKDGIGYSISAYDAEGAEDHADKLLSFLEKLE